MFGRSTRKTVTIHSQPLCATRFLKSDLEDIVNLTFLERLSYEEFVIKRSGGWISNVSYVL